MPNQQDKITIHGPNDDEIYVVGFFVPLIQKIEATSIGEIEKLIGEVQKARNFLQNEGERIQRETARYANLAKTASASVESS